MSLGKLLYLFGSQLPNRDANVKQASFQPNELPWVRKAVKELAHSRQMINGCYGGSEAPLPNLCTSLGWV